MNLEFWDGTTRQVERYEVLRTFTDDPEEAKKKNLDSYKKCAKCGSLTFHEVRLVGLDPETEVHAKQGYEPPTLHYYHECVKHMCANCKRVTEIM
jgi:hypothetical protein